MVVLNSSSIALSAGDPSLIDGLSADQQSRLTELLDRYLVGLENGERLDAALINRENPDLAEVFTSYLEKLDALYGVSVGFHDFQNDEHDAAGSSVKMTLGDFTIHREIGRGGMGVVYVANQVSLDRKVAIKLLPLASLLDSRQISRFKNEAHAAGLLQHPSIVPIHSVGSDRGVHYYAMQFIDGVSMDEWCANERSAVAAERHARLTDSTPSQWRTTIQWAIEIAGALHNAHENGVIHRDVKPSNLMLDRCGKIWITDFGLARCQSEVSLTQSGDVIGTMRYMSPEQARGQSALIDGRADVYSLAVTLYELLTLRPAHDGADAPSILQMIDQHDVTPLRQLRPDLPRDLETVISKAMAKSREGRYETAAAFADDLGRVLAAEPTLARPANLGDRVGRLAAKHRSVVLTGAVIVALGFVGSAVATAKLAVAKQVSDANAARALSGEMLARDAVDRLGSQMAELLSGIPAADSVRRQLLIETLDYYERFAAEVRNDPTLRADLAITLGKSGSLQSELGDNDKAIDSLGRSESIYRQLAHETPGDDALLLEWSTSQNNLAEALVRGGELEDAARYYARAITTQKSVAEHSAAKAFSRHAVPAAKANLALATTLNNLGLLLSQTGAVEQSEKAYLEAIELLENQQIIPETTHQISVAEHPAAIQLATVRANLSGLLTPTSPERAIEYAREALSGQLDALEADRGNAKLATQTIVTLNTLGAAQSAAKQNASAIETFRQAIVVGDQLLARWPDQATYQRDMVLSLNHLGLSLSKTGQLSEASDAFEKALDYGRPLAARFVTDAETRSMVGGVLNNLGFLRQQLGDRTAAAAAYDEAIQHQSAAVRLAPEVNRYREYLRKHKDNYQTVAFQSATHRRTAS